MEDLALRLAAAFPKAERDPCPVAKLLDSLPAETALLLGDLLASDVPVRTIHMQLQKVGIKIGRESMLMHRKGQCRCG